MLLNLSGVKTIAGLPPRKKSIVTSKQSSVKKIKVVVSKNGKDKKEIDEEVFEEPTSSQQIVDKGDQGE